MLNPNSNGHLMIKDLGYELKRLIWVDLINLK